MSLVMLWTPSSPESRRVWRFVRVTKSGTSANDWIPAAAKSWFNWAKVIESVVPTKTRVIWSIADQLSNWPEWLSR